MTIKNTPDTYGHIAKILHWVIALAVLGMMVVGTIMEDIPDKAMRFQVYGIHKALGVTILFLMVARLGWKLVNLGNPHHNAAHKPWEQKLAALIHWGFYGLLLVMPLSGWLLTGAAGSTINWFGLFPVPNIAMPNPDMREVYGEIHEITATLIWLALAAHIGGALKHAFIDRDNTIKRMMPIVIFAALLPAAAHAADDSQTIAWRIDRTQSTLGFEGMQEGGVFKGEFTAFDGTIRFDPKYPEKGTAHILIDLGSVSSGNAERDTTAKEKDWFDTATNPTSTYSVDYFEKGETDTDFIARGRLILRGVELALDLPFKLYVTESNGILTAHATGQTTLKRLDFGVGDGEWKSTDMVGNEFTVKIDITATAKAPKE